MTAKKIKQLLERALSANGKMAYALYEHELAEVVDDLKLSLKRDRDDYIFTVTENTGDIAMVLVEKNGDVHINEQARDRLQALWSDAYASNIKRMLPDFARQLSQGQLPINGVTVQRKAPYLG